MEEDKKLTEDEERAQIYLDETEEIRIRSIEEETGEVIPKIELLVCNRCDKCIAFAKVVSDLETGWIIEMDSILGRNKMARYGLTEMDHPVLIANYEVESVGDTLTEEEFRSWYHAKYGEEL